MCRSWPRRGSWSTRWRRTSTPGSMNRRPTYMYGAILDRSPTGQVSTGLGIDTSSGSVGLIAPTTDVTRTGQEETIDGVRIVFQITPGTEAPAEMNFYFPDRR